MFGKLARIAAVSILLAGVALAAEPTTQRSPTAKMVIVLAGDSTTATSSGWGNGFIAHQNAEVQVINMALGGRSSKSFIAEGWWKKCLAIKPDYVLIQFGHNDQPGHPQNRETDANTTYRGFMNQYVDEARAAGIKPVLVTSLSRRQWGKDGKIHSTLVPYVDVVKEIAAAKHVPILELHDDSIALYEKLGKEGCEALSPTKVAPEAVTTQPNPISNADAPATTGPDAGKVVYDGTHLNSKGAKVIGQLVADELKKAVPELAQYYKD